MSEPRGKGWAGPLYGINETKIWVNAFYRSYARATEIFLKNSTKKHPDILDLARKSQAGWELYKKLIKDLNKVISLYTPETAVLFKKVFEDDIERTIQMYSKTILIELKFIQSKYKDEFDYLTKWWSDVI